MVFQGGADIDIVSLGYQYRFLRPEARIRPYLGAGIEWRKWPFSASLTVPSITIGNISFPVETQDIIQDDGDAHGLFVVAGIDVELSPGWHTFIKVRRHEADDEISIVDSFTQTEETVDLDLSATEVSIGVGYRS